jgi:hypothetical protein
MRVIIAGSRTITSYKYLEKCIKASAFDITTIISGGAKGVDALGEEYAKNNDIPLEIFPAEWNKYGKSAGYKRNVIMAENAEALLALWDGVSKGTGHMLTIANDKGLKIKLFIRKSN